jgi:hypothetical protein
MDRVSMDRVSMDRVSLDRVFMNRGSMDMSDFLDTAFYCHMNDCPVTRKYGGNHQGTRSNEYVSGHTVF